MVGGEIPGEIVGEGRKLLELSILRAGRTGLGMSGTVPASEFTRNFGQYRIMAQREAVAVSSRGVVTGYFVGPDEYEAFKRFQAQRRSFATVELAPEKVRAIGASLMAARHADLNDLISDS